MKNQLNFNNFTIKKNFFQKSSKISNILISIKKIFFKKTPIFY